MPLSTARQLTFGRAVVPAATVAPKALTAAPRFPSCRVGRLCGVRLEEDLRRQALTKLRRGAPYSVAAVYVAEVRASGPDGVRWRTFVTDGESAGFVDAKPPSTVQVRSPSEVPPTLIEREVEYAAGRLARESRLERLLASSPVVIPL